MPAVGAESSGRLLSAQNVCMIAERARINCLNEVPEEKRDEGKEGADAHEDDEDDEPGVCLVKALLRAGRVSRGVR